MYRDRNGATTSKHLRLTEDSSGMTRNGDTALLLCQEELEMLRKGHGATAEEKHEASQNADLWHEAS